MVSTNQAFTVNDWLVGDTVDANGNTTASTKGVDAYDFENRLISRLGGGQQISLVYDGDGNRVRKTVNGLTTLYVVDDRNLTGYAQVLEEHTFQLSSTPSLQRVYTYGHDLIAQDQVWGGQWVLSFYGYDGHGSVRLLTDVAGTVTDAYDYDAFGVLLTQSSVYQTPTPNAYRYTGEQWDADLGFYYLRARYSNPETGRFWTMDSYEGQSQDPLTLHKYLYCHANPVNGVDPSGHENLSSVRSGMTIRGYLFAVAGSWAIGKYIDLGFQLSMYDDWSQIQVDLYNHWDLLNLIPAAAWTKAFNQVSRHLRALGLSAKHKKAITSARKATKTRPDTGFRDCLDVSMEVGALLEKTSTNGATYTLRNALGGQHTVCFFDGVIYDLSAGQYAKWLSQEALDRFAVAIGTGVFDPASHDEFMRLVAAARGL